MYKKHLENCLSVTLSMSKCDNSDNKVMVRTSSPGLYLNILDVSIKKAT